MFSPFSTHAFCEKLKYLSRVKHITAKLWEVVEVIISGASTLVTGQKTGITMHRCGCICPFHVLKLIFKLVENPFSTREDVYLPFESFQNRKILLLLYYQWKIQFRWLDLFHSVHCPPSEIPLLEVCITFPDNCSAEKAWRQPIWSRGYRKMSLPMRKARLRTKWPHSVAFFRSFWRAQRKTCWSLIWDWQWRSRRSLYQH